MMPTTTDPRIRARRRLATIVAAVLAAGAFWAAGIAVLDHDLTVPQSGGRAPMDVTLPMVLFVAAASSLLGWALLAALERRSPRGTGIWVAVATAVMLVSLVPLLAPGIADGTRIVLALLHLVVGAVLIPGMWQTSAAAAARAQADDVSAQMSQAG